MFKVGTGSTTRAAGLHDATGSRFVLPRPLRRPVRFLTRLCSGDVQFPRHLGSFVMVGTIAGSALYGSILGGQFGQAVERMTVLAGLGVSEVKLEGHEHTDPQDIFSALRLDGSRSLFSIDPAEARIALSSLPWVERGEIRKTYPGTLTVTVVERKPFAIWQTGDTLSVVEADGSVIGGYNGASLRRLPLLVGKGAAEAAAPFIKMISDYPELHEQVHAFVRVGQRRWNLRLRDGVTVKLPADNEADAMALALQLDREHKLFSRDVASVDLRIAGQVIVALTQNAHAARVAALKADQIDVESGRGAI